ncbi:hypothetical protein VNO77_34167 [Canavalia gladiata]|uniref:Uncharacterized protein n=1 Tax=Canavalia gladiata TaxID=3824 RepID=A0AAN9PX08_CANGL
MTSGRLRHAPATTPCMLCFRRSRSIVTSKECYESWDLRVLDCNARSTKRATDESNHSSSIREPFDIVNMDPYSLPWTAVIPLMLLEWRANGKTDL